MGKASSPTSKEVSAQAPFFKRQKTWMIIALALSTLTFWSPLSFSLFSKSIHMEKAFPKEDTFFKEYLSILQSGDEDKATSKWVSDQQVGFRTLFKKLSPILGQAGPLKDVHLLEYEWKMDNGQRVRVMTYWVDFEKGSYIVNFTPKRQDENYLAEGLWFNDAKASFQDSADFDLAGRPIFHYLFLAAAFAVLLWSSFVAVECAFRQERKKWLWILFILMGVMHLSINWLPGPWDQVNFHIEFFKVYLPMAGTYKLPLYDPWRVFLCLPLGALIYSLRERTRD